MTARQTKPAAGALPGYELLQAAGARELVAITDVVDRPHLVWTRSGEQVQEASAEECRLVLDLLMAGLVQLGDSLAAVPWYGGEAHGNRVLPTEQGLALLGQGSEAAEAGAPLGTWSGRARQCLGGGRR